MEEILTCIQDLGNTAKTLNWDFMFDVIIFAVLAIILFKFVGRFRKHLKIKMEEHNSSMVRFLPVFERLMKSLILFFLLATFLQSHGYSMNSIIAGFGITGLAVGFAAKETIANIFGAIAIFSDKSFKIGDSVVINGVEGTVEDINMRSTKLRAADNSVVIIPNSLAASSVIKNVSQTKRRRILETIGVTYSTNDKKLRRATAIIEEILAKSDELAKDRYVFVDKFADSSVDIKFSAYVRTNDYVKYAKIREGILLEILAAYRSEKIELAFPSQTVYVKQNEK